MSAEPRWEPTDQADLLSLVRDEGHPSTDYEFDLFVRALHTAADDTGRISPNTLRPLVRGSIAPRRIGAFTSSALAKGLIAYTGEWEVSNDREGRNGGKPARVLRLIGEQP